MRDVAILFLCLGCLKPAVGSDNPPQRIETSAILKAPHVVRATVAPAKGGKRQILHIFNWHFVDRKAFEADGGGDWEAFLDSVESVQSEQVDLLKYLKNVHGIDAVFLEGLTDADVEGYRKLAGALARWKEPKGGDALSEFLHQQHREDTLLLGAAAKVEGIQVLASEDLEALKTANPVKEGKVEYDEKAMERREDAIVKRMLATERTVMVLIMGGGHDLVDNIKRLNSEVEYVRVVVKAHREIQKRSKSADSER